MRYCSGTLVKQFLSNFTYVVLTQKMRYCSETEEKNSLIIIQEGVRRSNEKKKSLRRNCSENYL
jgi:hypothetical protein